VLDRAAIEADFGAIAARFEFDAEMATSWPQFPESHETPAVVEAIECLRERRPHFFKRFDYGWATDPRGYSNGVEARFQLEALIALTEIDEGHPALLKHRPTVVRLIPLRDFNSTTVRGDLCDYILICEPYFALTREFAVLVKRTFEAANDIGLDDVGSTEREWLDRALQALKEQDRERVDKLLTPLQRHAVSLIQQTVPFQPEMLGDWLSEGVVKGRRIALEISLTYVGMDRFVLYHELAHCLAADRHNEPRDLVRELDADRGALSLMVARIGSPLQKEPTFAKYSAYSDELVFGAASYLALLRTVLLFSGVFEATANLADQWMAPREGSVIEGSRTALAEVEVRLAQLWIVVGSFNLDDIAGKVLRRVLAMHALQNVAAAKLLSDSSITFLPEELGQFDLGGALKRLKEVKDSVEKSDG